MLALEHWHIEVSSICALKCPRCPRAEVPENLLNRQLSLGFFKTQIGEDVIGNIKKITFCGNDGDPIYAKEFLDICSWIKKINPNIQLVIVTNGSHRPIKWWQHLASILNEYDEIHWSLDGWDQESNNLYRINSDWNNIANGIKNFRLINKSTYTVWASIAFSFNEKYLEKQQNLANLLEFDLYQVTKSTKFGSKYPEVYGKNDYLEPTNSTLVSSGYRFERIQFEISKKTRPGKELKQLFFQRAENLDKHNTYSGICLIGNKGIFLNSRGEFYPCCWTANRYKHNSNWHLLAQTKFNLHHRTFNEIINDDFWKTDFLKFDSLECQTKCTQVRLKDIEHTTEW